MRTLSRYSTEYVTVTVTDADGNSLVGTSVELSLPRTGQPPTVWITPDTSVIDGASITAAVLVGPDGLELQADRRYDIWYKLTDTPEEPVAKVDTLDIT